MSRFLKKNYLKELTLDGQASQLEKDFESWLEDEIKVRGNEIERRHNITPEVFYEEYRQPGRPVILTGLTDNWTARQKWNFDFFKEKLGDITVKVNPHSKTRYQTMSISNLVDEIKQHQIGEPPIYLQEWNYQADTNLLDDDYDTPPHIIRDCHFDLFSYQTTILWIGSKGSTTYLHQDYGWTNSCAVQIRGKKKWNIFSPEAILECDKNGKPQYEKFLDDPMTGALYATLEPGDIIYVPVHWWHRVQALDDNISMSYFIVNNEDYSSYINTFIVDFAAMILNKDLMLKYNPQHYRIMEERLRTMMTIMNFNVDDILNVVGH